MSISHEVLWFYSRVKLMEEFYGWQYVWVMNHTSDIIDAERKYGNYTEREIQALQTSFRMSYDDYNTHKYSGVTDAFKYDMIRQSIDRIKQIYEPLSDRLKQFIRHQIEMCNVDYILTDAELTNMPYIKRHLHMLIVVSFKDWKLDAEYERRIAELINQLSLNTMTTYVSDVTPLNSFLSELANISDYPVRLIREIFNLLRQQYKPCINDNSIKSLVSVKWFALLYNAHMRAIIINELNAVSNRTDIIYEPTITGLKKALSKLIIVNNEYALRCYLSEINN